MGIDTPPAIEQTVENHRLFITEATKNMLGADFVEKLPELAGMNLLIISPEDLKSDRQNDFANFLGQFPEFPAKGFLDSYGVGDRNAIASAASIGMGKSVTMPAFNEASGHSEPACIVTLTKLTDINNALGELVQLSGISAERFKDVPAPLMTLRQIAAHEAKHCSQEFVEIDTEGNRAPLTDDHQLMLETDADDGAVRFMRGFYGDQANQVVLFDEFYRAAAPFFDNIGIKPTHITSAGVTWDENKPGIKAEGQEYIDGLDGAKQKIYARIGDDLIGSASIQEIYTEMRDLGFGERLKISEDLGIKEGTPFDEKFRDRLDPAAQPYFDFFKENKSRSLGAEEARANQELFFETAKRMLHENAFSDNPIGQRYVEQFVTGVDHHLDGNVKPNIFEANANRIAVPPRPSP